MFTHTNMKGHMFTHTNTKGHTCSHTLMAASLLLCCLVSVWTRSVLE